MRLTTWCSMAKRWRGKRRKGTAEAREAEARVRAEDFQDGSLAGLRGDPSDPLKSESWRVGWKWVKGDGRGGRLVMEIGP